MATKQTPNDFLKVLIGRSVVVRLNSGVDYKGAPENKLCCVCAVCDVVM